MYRDVYGYYDTPYTTSFNISNEKVNEIIIFLYVICIFLLVIMVVDFIYSIIFIYEYCKEKKNKELSLTYVV